MRSLGQMLNWLDMNMRSINYDCPRQIGTEGHPINSNCLFVKTTKHLATFIHMTQAISTGLESRNLISW